MVYVQGLSLKAVGVISLNMIVELPAALFKCGVFGLTIRKHRLDALESASDEDEIP